MAPDRFVEQIRLARATAATARQLRGEALAARARCVDLVRQDRLLRLRVGARRCLPGSVAADQPKASVDVGPVRVVDRANSAHALLSNGHQCWAYQDRAEFVAHVRECVVDGIATGQRVAYVGSGSAEVLRAELTGLGGVLGGVLDGGSVAVSPIGDFYPFDGHSNVIDPGAAVDACAAATEKARAAGYSGLRLVADATAMVRTPKQREAFACFEHLIDRLMTVAPISGLCGYDSSELGDAAVAELACLHPLATAGSAPFQLYTQQGVDFALAGNLDLSCAELFATTMRRVVPLSSGSELVVDGRAVQFIDHRRLLVLIEAAQRAGATVILRNAPGTAARIVEALELGGVRVEWPR